MTGPAYSNTVKFEGAPSLQLTSAKNEALLKDEVYVKEKLTSVVSTRDDASIPEAIYFPKGEKKPYTKSVLGLDWGESFQENACTCIVFGENNEVYFNDIILRVASLGFGSYVKGEIKDDKIIVPVPQTLVEYEGGWGRQVDLMEKTDDGEWIVSKISEIIYSYNPVTGIIQSELPGKPGQYAIGLKWSFDDTWNEIGDFLQVYTPYDGEFMSVPEGLALEEYFFNDGNYAYPVEVGIQGDDLYIKGMSLASPSSVLKAKINGNKGYIPQNELLGTVMGYFIWTKMMVPDPQLGWALISPEQNYDLDIDLENKKIKSADPEQILIFNCEYNRVFYLDGYNNFTLFQQTSFAGTPKNPFGISFDGDEFREFYGIYGFNFNISNISTEGNVLDPGYLYYSIYLDGDILEFEEIEGLYSIMYPGVEGVVTRMPFDFSNGYDIDASSETGRFIGIYPDGVTTIGVQAFYEYEGKTTCSDIVTYNVETDEITDSGVEIIEASEVKSKTYYDINGRKLLNPEKGLGIVQYHLNNGKTITKKILRH